MVSASKPSRTIFRFGCADHFQSEEAKKTIVYTAVRHVVRFGGSGIGA